MNKENFIARNNKFIEFLSKVIAGRIEIKHSYLEEAFSFRVLEDAFDAYVFPFKSTSAKKYKQDPLKWRLANQEKLFPANKLKLDTIKSELEEAFNSETPEFDSFFTSIKRALYWGATGEIEVPEFTKRQGTYAENVKWLESNYPDKSKLYADFKSAVKALESNNFEKDQFGKNASFRMNAGFTKVYALLASNFIIYDGRVGAALGYLVALFLEHSGDDLTNDLQFHWGKSESKERYRDPSIIDKGWIFPKLNNNSEGNWAESNVKANWLLSSAIEMLPSSFIFGGYKKENMLHAVEASLFMLGYDFPNLKPRKSVTEHHDEQRLTPQNAQIESPSKMSLAKSIFEQGQKDSLSRKEILIKFQDEAGLTKAGANTYYQKIKSAF